MTTSDVDLHLRSYDNEGNNILMAINNWCYLYREIFRCLSTKPRVPLNRTRPPSSPPEEWVYALLRWHTVQKLWL